MGADISCAARPENPACWDSQPIRPDQTVADLEPLPQWDFQPPPQQPLCSVEKYKSHACDQEPKFWPEMSGHTVNAFCGLIVCCMFFVWLVIALYVLNKCCKKLMRGLRRKRRYIYDTLEISIG